MTFRRIARSDLRSAIKDSDRTQHAAQTLWMTAMMVEVKWTWVTRAVPHFYLELVILDSQCPSKIGSCTKLTWKEKNVRGWNVSSSFSRCKSAPSSLTWSPTMDQLQQDTEMQQDSSIRISMVKTHLSTNEWDQSKRIKMSDFSSSESRLRRAKLKTGSTLRSITNQRKLQCLSSIRRCKQTM